MEGGLWEYRKKPRYSYRTATFVPIEKWTQRTGEDVMSGWFVLGHDYPIPSDWKSQSGRSGFGMQDILFAAGTPLQCAQDCPQWSYTILGVMGAFRLDSADKMAPDVIPLVEGMDSGASNKRRTGT